LSRINFPATQADGIKTTEERLLPVPKPYGRKSFGGLKASAKAIEMLNGRLFRDRNLVVDEARPQPQRGAGGGGGPRGGGPGGPRGGGGGGGGGGWRR